MSEIPGLGKFQGFKFKDYAKKLTKESKKNKTGIIIEISFVFFSKENGKSYTLNKSSSYVLRDSYENVYRTSPEELIDKYIDFSGIASKDELESATNKAINIYIIDIESYRPNIENGHGILYQFYEWAHRPVETIKSHMSIRRFEMYGATQIKQYRRELTDYDDNVNYIEPGTRVKFRDPHGESIYDGIVVINYDFIKDIIKAKFPEGFKSDLYAIVYDNPRKDEPGEDPYIITYGHNKFVHRCEILEYEETPTGLEEMETILEEQPVFTNIRLGIKYVKDKRCEQS